MEEIHRKSDLLEIEKFQFSLSAEFGFETEKNLQDFMMTGIPII